MKTQEVIEEITATFSALKEALSGFSESTFNAVPFEGSWTAGQVTQHIVKSIGGIPDETTQTADRPYDEKIKPIRELFLDMDVKFKAAPFLEPDKPPHSLSEQMDTLDQLKQQHIDTVGKVDLVALCTDMELPTFGYLTRYEWIRFMMAHTQRHTLQIQRILQLV